MTPTVVRQGIEDRLARMIQVPTVSAHLTDIGLAPFTDFTQLLTELYPLTHEHLTWEQVTDLGLLYRWKGTTPSRDPVVLMAHFDVVPASEAEGWDHPPFAGVVHDGYVWGRGALDDKGPLAVIFEAVENLLSEGFTPARDVYLSLGGNEETFGDAAATTAALLHKRGITPWLVIDEGGAVVDPPFPFVEGDSAMIGVAEKGIATVRLSARSEGGHASAPKGLTAVARVARAVDRLRAGTFPARTPYGVTRMLQAFASRAPRNLRFLLERVAASPALTARVLAAAGGEMAAMVRTTIAATMIDGGSAANVLPAQASATLNLRIAIGETVASAVRRVRLQVRDPRVTVELVEGSEPSPEAPVDAEQFELIARACRVSHPAAKPVPYIVMAATDSRHYHRWCPHTYRFAPLRMSAQERATIHGVNERVQVSELYRGESFHRALLRSLA